MRNHARSERGQATVEWTGILLLVALALGALAHFAPRADGRELGTSLAGSITGVGHKSGAYGGISAPHPGLPRRAAPLGGAALPALPRLPKALRTAGRGAGAVWRKAWFACLAYARARYAIDHPEISVPGYTLPYRTALQMINNCVSPVDVLRDVPGMDSGGP
jgi:hypothetical protein